VENIAPALKTDRVDRNQVLLPPGVAPHHLEWINRGVDMHMLVFHNAKVRMADDWTDDLFHRVNKRFKLNCAVQPPGSAATTMDFLFKEN
jgi:hypothetical protein